MFQILDERLDLEKSRAILERRLRCRQKECLPLLYGPTDFMTNAELARHLSLSPERTRQIRNDILRSWRAILSDLNNNRKVTR